MRWTADEFDDADRDDTSGVFERQPAEFSS
jgi:hypothetical protein